MQTIVPMRHFVLIELNGKRETVVSRHATRFDAARAKKRIEGTVPGRLVVKARWSRRHLA